MADDVNIQRRHSIRLQGYDYSQAGAYFVTICTQNRECLLGSIVFTRCRAHGGASMERDTPALSRF